MKLYSYFRSSSAYRVRLALNLKNLEYEIVPVHLLKDGGEQHKPEYASINPANQLPSLVIDGQTITQSMAICLYLEDAFTEKPLLSKEAITRAHQISFCEVINSGIQPLQNLSILNKLDDEFKIGKEGKIKWIQDHIHRYFTVLEKTLEKTSGDFCFGDEISLAECFLVPQVFSAKRFSVDMNRFPLINKIDKATETLDAFRKAHPENQPDFEV